MFDRGLVVAASSPLAADAVVRVALTNHTITPSQVNDIKRRIALAPSLDEVDVLASAIGLAPDKTVALRNRVITQRAARTFALEQGEYHVEDHAPSTGPVTAGVDVRAVIYTGARMNLVDERMASDLRRFGARYILREDAIPDLPKYGFGDTERPVLAALRDGTSLPELEALHRELDPRSAQAIIYALASCDGLVTDPFAGLTERAIHAGAGGRRAPSQSGPITKSGPIARSGAVHGAVYGHNVSSTAIGSNPKRPPSAPHTPIRSRLTTVEEPLFGDDPAPAGVPRDLHDAHAAETRAVPIAMMIDPTTTETVRVTVTPELLERVAAGVPPSRELMEAFRTGAMTTVRPNALTRRETEVLIAERYALVDGGADHFALLGVELGAPIEEVHAAYVELARNLAPDRLIELGIIDDTYKAHAVLAQVSIAFTVLTDRLRRPEYIASLQQKLRTRTASRR
ncbi:MAG: hypothetical protein KF773_27690 [Deltaproteobacteria bacterium]|nr:hypothetical protein [Deltaproteobacteria bacterium]